MSKVLIISKTRKGKYGACVGGITIPELKSVRLLNADGTHHKAETEFQIGQLWEMDLKPAPKLIPPHVENVLIQSKRLIKEVDSFESVIEEDVLSKIVWQGHPTKLFQGLLSWTGNRSGFVSKDAIPDMSTGFWIPNKDLSFDGKSYYIYDDGRGKYNSRFGFKYVGFEKPVDTIPANTRVRVSLATWWHPDDAPDMEDRCYLQLSGWYSS